MTDTGDTTELLASVRAQLHLHECLIEQLLDELGAGGVRGDRVRRPHAVAQIEATGRSSSVPGGENEWLADASPYDDHGSGVRDEGGTWALDRTVGRGPAVCRTGGEPGVDGAGADGAGVGSDGLASEVERAEPTPIRWRELSREEAQQVWHELIDWVRWLTTRYYLTEILPCWYRHGAMVEELSALWRGWCAAYDREAMAADALFWHDHLDRARGRLQQWAKDSACRTAGEHREPRAIRPVDSVQLRDFLAADLLNRDVGQSVPANTGRAREIVTDLRSAEQDGGW